MSLLTKETDVEAYGVTVHCTQLTISCCSTIVMLWKCNGPTSLLISYPLECMLTLSISHWMFCSNDLMLWSELTFVNDDLGTNNCAPRSWGRS